MAVNASEPVHRANSSTRSRSRRPGPNDSHTTPPKPPRRTFSDHSSSSNTTSDFNSGSSYRLDTSVATNTATGSSRASLSSFRQSLPENAHIYDFSDIRAATNNFLLKRHSTTSSSQSWRSTLSGRDVIIFQRKSREKIEKSELKSKLSSICRIHQKGIIKLLGASISSDYIYLVYEFINGSNLSACLRNPRNPNFTVLSTWMSRMQIATDVAHGLEYIHHHTGLDLVHKHVKSTGIIVTEPQFHAKICHFGAAELCGETAEPETRRSGEFEGVRGYMSPEFQTTGETTQKSDVYAFGVVLLELLTGEEPVKYKYDKATGNYQKISIIDTAREVLDGDRDGDDAVEGRLRRWIDRRLKDSFPVTAAEKLTRVALECVHVEADKRPDMKRVAGKISKFFMESEIWSDQVKVPSDFTVSLAPR